MAPVHELSHVRRTSLESRFRFFLTRSPHIHAGLSLFEPSLSLPRDRWLCVLPRWRLNVNV